MSEIPSCLQAYKEKEPLLYAERGIKPHAEIESTLCPADTTSPASHQRITYYHPDSATQIRYERIISSRIAHSLDQRFAAPCYRNRNEALYQESLMRLQSRAHLPVSERYRGYENSITDKIKGIVKRVFYIITRRSVKKGLQAYDLHLASQEQTLSFANYSTKPAANFKIEILPYQPLLQHLGMRNFLIEQNKLQFTSRWHRNGLPSYQFSEDGKTVTLHHTVVSSNDKTNDHIAMMRHVNSVYSGASTFYTGRPDSESKAKEQVEFIFRNEMRKSPDTQKGLVYNQEADEYELTYVVNNMISSHGAGSIGLTWVTGFDEREAVLSEMEVLANLRTLTIDQKQVKVKPLYFNQCFTCLNAFGKSSLQKEINRIGYKELLALAWQAPQNPLLTSAIHHLEHPDDLLPEEEFFYRNLICKMLKLPEVIHCKNSTDQTMLSGAISMATEQWLNCHKPIPEENPHAILSDPIYKELFIANVMSGPQETLYSHPSAKNVKETRQFSKLLSYNWGINRFLKNVVALRMVPERYKKKAKHPLRIRAILVVLKFFHPTGAAKRIVDLERAYKEEAFDDNSVGD